MSRSISPSLRLLPWLLLACAGATEARTLQARIARVTTGVATLEGVDVRLDWPAQATQGELMLSARRVDASALGYRFEHLRWRCPLQREGKDGWRCEGELRGSGGRPLRLSVVLGPATTDAVLSQGSARFAVNRDAGSPDFTALELTRVPAAWTQALLSQAWKDARFKSGTFDARLNVRTPKGAPLRIDGNVAVAGLGLETTDATVAAENIGGRFDLDYRRFPHRTLVTIDGQLRGGEFLAGNAYVALPATPVAVQVDAEQLADKSWRLPHLSWRDGEALSAEGSAVLASDASVRSLELDLTSRDLGSTTTRYLSGWLGLAGLAELELRGGFDASLRMDAGRLHAATMKLHAVDVIDPRGRFRFDAISGTPKFSAGAPVSGELQWRGGELYGLAFGPASAAIDSRDGMLRLRDAFSVPVLGGSLRFDGLTIRPPGGAAGSEMSFGLSVDQLDIGQLAKALGWPEFRGELSGRIPNARYANDRLDFDGGLTMRMFDGTVEVSSLAMERPFGTAPSLSADIDFDDLDLLALTEVFDFGSITGRLDGHIHALRLVDWSATAFEAELRTDRKPAVRQRISQRAVQSISSVGDGSGFGVAGIQGQLIGLFDDFGYARIGISCRLGNEICEMGGLGSAGNAFTILEGSGLPRLTVIGHNRLVDWPTLVERLAAVGKGEVKPVVE